MEYIYIYIYTNAKIEQSTRQVDFEEGNLISPGQDRGLSTSKIVTSKTGYKLYVCKFHSVNFFKESQQI